MFLGFDPFIVGDVKVINQTREDIKGKQPLTREKREYIISIQNLNPKKTLGMVCWFGRREITHPKGSILNWYYNLKIQKL